ncbi:CSC1-like protein [Panicum miliaceum]|uniref:CSC1-like protein n=1 Tax=Panicum miliaceum TaxID=4540 RepID=A0A3L6TL24_PANMI|nr:CSC1-like protein [Panicum miliaceum]
MVPVAQPPDAIGGGDPEAWYGSIQYLINISAVGAASCVLLFLLVKLRFDHRRIPGPSALAAKLLAVYHATAPQIALHCGADAAQFLLFERASFLILAAVAAAASSPLLWLHLLLTAIAVAIAHLGISRMEDALRITRFRDGNGNPSDPNSSSVAVFTIMIQGIPKTLAADKTPLKDYFEHKYPGKVYRVIVPFDLCTLEYLVQELGKVRNKISWLEARVRGFPAGNDGKLMDRVLCIMQFCVIFFLAAMLLFFAVQGDSMKLQAICTLGMLVFYKLLPSRSDRFQSSLLEGMQTVNSFVDGPTDYEVFSQPDLDWDLYQS